MKIIIFISIIIQFSLHCLHSQVQDWVNTYNGPASSNDYLNDMVTDASGNVYVTGHSKASGTSDDYTTIKYNTTGGVEWTRRYNGTGDEDDVALDIAIDNAGNVYVTGWSDGVSGFADCVTIMYNSFGDRLWLRRYTGSGGNHEGRSVAVDASGNVYVLCTSSSAAWVQKDLVTIKYNSLGERIWVQKYTHGATGGMVNSSLTLNGSGDVIVSGTGYANNQEHALTIKYGSDSSLHWVKKYIPDSANTRLFVYSDVITDAFANVYIAGGLFDIYNDYDIFLIKYDVSGNEEWVRTHNGASDKTDKAYATAVDGSGNVYVTGISDEVYGHDGDCITIKYNTDGVKKWIRRYETVNGESNTGRSIAVGTDGNIYVAAKTFNDITTIKYGPGGVEKWNIAYTISNTEYLRTIALDGMNNVYVSGVISSLSGSDFITIKYSQSASKIAVGSETNSNTPQEYGLSQNYPNPFNPATNIKFDIPKAGFVKLVIYDITGGEVTALINNQLNAGSYNVDFDASQLPSGAYFYRITAGEFTEIKKMILIK